MEYCDILDNIYKGNYDILSNISKDYNDIVGNIYKDNNGILRNICMVDSDITCNTCMDNNDILNIMNRSGLNNNKGNYGIMYSIYMDNINNSNRHNILVHIFFLGKILEINFGKLL